jgi:hypothetical protein
VPRRCQGGAKEVPRRCQGGVAQGSCRHVARGGRCRAMEGSGGRPGLHSGTRALATVRAWCGHGAGMVRAWCGHGAGGVHALATPGSALTRNSNARSSRSPCRMRPAATASRTSVRASLGFASPASSPPAAAASASARATAASMPDPPDPPATATCPCACPCASTAPRFTSSLLRTSAARTCQHEGGAQSEAVRHSSRRASQRRRPCADPNQACLRCMLGRLCVHADPSARGALARTLTERRRPSAQVISW